MLTAYNRTLRVLNYENITPQMKAAVNYAKPGDEVYLIPCASSTEPIQGKVKEYAFITPYLIGMVFIEANTGEERNIYLHCRDQDAPLWVYRTMADAQHALEKFFKE